MARALLEVDNVSKIYSVGFIRKRYIEAVRSISFIIPDKGAFIGLVGESGSGKTTIARMILGLINPSSGEIRYKGRNIFRLSKEEWIEYRKNVQPVFQDPYNAYNPFYRIDRVLRIPIRTFRLASSKEDAEKLIEEAMMAVGLRPEDILGRYPHQLSGGERQRIMLARLHIIKPRLIVADEPLSMVDVSLKARFLNELLKFKKAYGTSCLYITHDLSEAYYISDTLMVLCRGRIVERGPTDSIINNPAHPYTRMLLNSIPIPDPERRWRERIIPKVITGPSRHARGCVFYDNCRFRKERCLKEEPYLVEIEHNHEVACYLYT